MLDNALTNDIQNWLAQPEAECDIEAGATLLLRLNRNRWMYDMICRKRNYSKLAYELRKHLAIRLEGLTTEQVVAMERAALPLAQESIEAGAPVISTEDDVQAAHRGRRADHDALPADVRALYERNGEVYFKMKNLFETLKQMENETACDRHELLKQLAELDREYRENWQTYDNASPDDGSAEQTVAETATACSAKAVIAARKFISTNRKALAEAIASGDSAKAEKLRSKMQQRVDTILAAGLNFDAEYRAEIETLGLDCSHEAINS